MSSHPYKPCPRCGTTLPPTQSFSGSPIRICPACSQEVFDKDIREPGFYTPPKRTWNWFKSYGLYLVIISILWLIGCVGALRFGHPDASWWPIVFPYPVILLAIPTFVMFRREHKKNQAVLQEYKASTDRLSDKTYILRLLNYGYRVPVHYLSAYYPDLVNYKPSSQPQTKDGKIFYL